MRREAIIVHTTLETFAHDDTDVIWSYFLRFHLWMFMYLHWCRTMFLNEIHYNHNTQTSCNIYVFLPSQPAKPEDLCMVCYTSGTTGEQHVWIATRLLHTRLLLKLLDYYTCLYFCFKLLFSLLIYFTVVKTDQFLKYFLISYAAQILNIHPV